MFCFLQRRHSQWHFPAWGGKALWVPKLLSRPRVQTAISYNGWGCGSLLLWIWPKPGASSCAQGWHYDVWYVLWSSIASRLIWFEFDCFINQTHNGKALSLFSLLCGVVKFGRWGYCSHIHTQTKITNLKVWVSGLLYWS